MPRRAKWMPNKSDGAASCLFSLLIIFAGSRDCPFEAFAAAHTPIAGAHLLQTSTPAGAVPQRTTATTGTGRSTEASPSGALAAKTAQEWMVEGHRAQKAGNQVEAVRDFLNAQRLEPTSPEPFYALGMSFFIIGWYENDSADYDRAARHFKAALDLDPKFHRAEFMVGMMEVVHLRLKEAMPHFQKAISLDPQNPYYHLHYGILLARMDRSDDAVAQMLLAEKVGPNYASSYSSLGQLYSEMGKYPEARGQLERAVHLDPNAATAYYTLGGVYHHLGMTAESKSAYETFQRLKAAEPKADPVEKALQGRGGKESN